jgi:signal transduction histidine kinase
MTKDLLADLKSVPEFKSVPENQLQWLVDHGEIRSYHDGDRVFGVGDSIDGFSVVFSGKLQLYAVRNGNRLDMGAYEPREILGRLPYSRMKAASGEGFAVGNLEVLFLHRDFFQEMINQCHEITEALVHNMTDRVREFTKYQQQNDKMMALGKLSAGLAHELNNPSAAIVRSAQELKKRLKTAPIQFKRVLKIRTDDNVVDKLNAMVFEKIDNHGKKILSLSQRTSLEDELGDWLDQHGIPEPWQMTETFADYGFSVEDFESVNTLLRPEDVPSVIGWLNQVLSTEKLVCEIEESSKRINTLVTSVKGYTHMDQAPEKQKTDIHAGIRNTLIMLNHKLKKGGIKVVEDFRHDPPEANILVSEMNQVWTNLIDNAIDAMEGRPNSVLEIKTERDREFTKVYIVDNGPGIPKDVVDKIFDAFFTTKPVGKGTGLGLEVARNIVVQHSGKIEVSSEPGKTSFLVCFPTN